MATISSAVSGSNIVYTITDAQANTITVTAPPVGSTAVSFSGSGQPDAQNVLAQLLLQLASNLRPQVMAGTTASFTGG